MPSDLVMLDLDEDSISAGGGSVQGRLAALQDLLEHNHFVLSAHPVGPYHLRLAVADHQLLLLVRDIAGTLLEEVTLPLSSLCRREGDCRGFQDEAATLLQESLAGRVEMDHATACRILALIWACGLREMT